MLSKIYFNFDEKGLNKWLILSHKIQFKMYKLIIGAFQFGKITQWNSNPGSVPRNVF